jgi:hypothetical protein
VNNHESPLLRIAKPKLVLGIFACKWIVRIGELCNFPGIASICRSEHPHCVVRRVFCEYPRMIRIDERTDVSALGTQQRIIGMLLRPGGHTDLLPLPVFATLVDHQLVGRFSVNVASP